MYLKWLLAVLGMAAAIGGTPAKAAWLEAKTRHFVLYADMGEEQLREKAIALERVDWSLRRFMKVEDHADAVHNKLTVYWTSVSDFQSFCRCPNVAGLYRPRVTGSIAYATRHSSIDGDFGQVVLFHEYAHHFMLGNYNIAFPNWFSEGFAEFASTLRLTRESATIGAAAQHRAWGLFSGRRATARDMLDPAEADKQRRLDADAFYGRGWLLTHYLLFNPQRMEQFKAYLVALNGGKPSLAAAQEAFGDLDALSRDVDRYLARRTLTAMTMRFADAPVPQVEVRRLGAGEAAMVKMRMASTFGVDKATAGPLFAKAAPVAARYPDDPVVQGWLAEMAYDAGDDAAALAAADRAIARDPKSTQALLYRARIDMRRLAAASNATPADWIAARKPILAANRLNPDDAEPLWTFYQSFVTEGREPSKSAFAGLYRAQDLIPQDPGVRFAAAMARLNAGEAGAARALLRPLAYNPHASGDNVAAKIVAALDAGVAPREAAALAVREGSADGATATD